MTPDREKLKAILDAHKKYGFKKSEMRYKCLEDLFYHGRSAQTLYDLRLKEIFKILEEQNISYTTGNEASRGGHWADYITLTSPESLAEIDQEKEEALIRMRDSEFEGWKIKMCKWVSKEWGEKAYGYLSSFANGEIEVSDEEWRKMPSGNKRSPVKEEIAKRNNIEYDMAFVAACERYRLHERQKKSSNYKELKKSISAKDCFKPFDPHNNIEYDIERDLRAGLEEEGVLNPCRPFKI